MAITNKEYYAERIADCIIRNKDSLSEQWNNPKGTPTRHFFVDNLLSEEDVAQIYEAFPQDSSIWVQQQSFREQKKTFAKLDSIDPCIAACTDAFHSDNVLKAIAETTGLTELEADPELYAGGISMMGLQDFLNPHIDNSHDATRKRYRRLNLLYYITPDWSQNNGGNLELWNEQVTQPKVIASKYNRLVVMETNKYSWHSVQPVSIDENRCCISNYYFSKGSPEKQDYYHVTSFLGRPQQKMRRIWGRIDNFIRQMIAVNLKVSRGKSQSRFEK